MDKDEKKDKDLGEQKDEQKDEKKDEQKDEQKDEKKEDKKKYTDEDFDRLFDKKFAKFQAEKEAELDEAKKLAEMNAQEKAEHERDKLEAELNELRKSQTLAEMTSTARAMLKEANVSIDDNLLATLVDADADTTKTNVESFKKSFNEAVEEEVLNRIKNPNHKRGTVSKITKKEIMAIADTTLRQKKIKENLHLFE